MARVISGLVMAIAVVAMILMVPVAICQYIIAAFSLICAWEFFTVISLGQVNRFAGVILTAVGVLGVLFKADQFDFLSYLYVVMTTSFLMQLFGTADDNKARYLRAAGFCLGVVYVVVSFSYLVRLFTLEHFRFWIFLVLASTFLGDTFAYFAGRSFGKRKLAPTISPGKTNAGLWGALLGGIVGAMVVRILFWPEAPLLQTLLIGLFVALIGAMGDLSESLIKRAFSVKDSGNLIPGHGGLLDRLDGLMFTAPFVYSASHWMGL